MSVYPIARIGDRGKPEIDYAKRAFGFVDNSDLFCSGLAARVRGFQLSHNLQVTGTLDADTLARLGYVAEDATRRKP